MSITSNVYSLYDELKNYNIETLVNNAGFGDYSKVNNQNLEKVESMLSLNIEALVILSSLFVRDYEKIEGTQLINIFIRRRIHNCTKCCYILCNQIFCKFVYRRIS